MTFSIALSGDSIINRRISVCEDPGFQSIVDVLRSADVSYTHLETLITDYDDTDVYPAAVPGEMALRSPAFVAEELDWAGIDLVSHASNHALDLGYGALRNTWDAMERVDIPLAGTGETLADARAPAYLDTPHGRVALISMTPSFTAWSPAGERRPDMGGRPGLNPLRTHHQVNEDTLESIISLAEQMGQWVIQLDEDQWGIHPPGLHNSLTIYEIADVDEPRMVLDERDQTGNTEAIGEAARQADLVIAQIHTHEWDPEGNIEDPPRFIEQFSRDCIDVGADIVINQGSHAPLRGIELYQDRPIFYDPGDIIMMLNSIARQPAEYFNRFAPDLDMPTWEASVADVYEARPAGYHTAENPDGGYTSGSVHGLVVPVCEFSENYELESITLHPATIMEEPVANEGIPTRASGEDATELLEHVRGKSEPYGTSIDIDDDTGRITL